MTLKHIKFHESPVMRELERQAIRKNKSLKVELIKKASLEEETFGPTNNFFSDLISLASGLRKKGYNVQANSLEEKILNYKKASAEFIEELSKAHPEGDAEVADASNDLGKVETLESVHKKIIDIVNKGPTGKTANKIDSILESVQSSLGIKKKADPTAEDVFSGNQTDRLNRINQINSNLSESFPRVSDILTLTSDDIDLNKWVFKYTDLFYGTKDFRTLYASYAGINEDIERFFQIHNHLYGENFNGDEYGKLIAVISTLAKDKNIPELIRYGNSVGGGFGNKFFSGSQPNEGKTNYLTEHPDRANDQIFKDNSNSIFTWWVDWALKESFQVDQEKVKLAAKEIQQAHYNHFESLFSEEKLNQATLKVQADLKGILTPWNEVKSFFANPPRLTESALSIASLLMSIQEQQTKLNNYSVKGELFKGLLVISSKMWPEWNPPLAEKAQRVSEQISQIIGFLNNNALNPADPLIQDSSKVVDTLMAAAKMFWAALKNIDPKSQTYKDYTQNQNVTFALAQTVKAGTGKPYALILNEVKKVFPSAISYNVLVQETNKWLEESSQITGFPVEQFVTKASNQLKPELKKLGQLVRRPAAPTAPAASTPSTNKQTTPVAQPASRSYAPNGLAKANMNDPKEAAVALMQQYLAYFAESLSTEEAKKKFKAYDPQDVARIVRTGPKANPAVNTYDGKWGTETESALTLANKYLKQLGVGELDVKARYKHRTTADDAEAVAKKNSQLLSQANQILTGKASSSAPTGVVYDRLPETIDWNNIKYPLMEHKIPVSENDFASLGNFYDCIVKNNWLSPSYVTREDGFDVEGFSARTWDNILQWFQRRAQFIYNASLKSDKSLAEVARQYFDAAKRLQKQLRSFFITHGYDSRNETEVVDIEALKEYSSKAGAKSSNRWQPRTLDEGEAESNPQILDGSRPSRRVRTVSYNGNIPEGQDWISPDGDQESDDPPIGPNGVINLASRWFNGLDQKLGISHNPLLNPSVFKRYTAADLAKTFYANAGGDADDQAKRQALVVAGLDVERYDEEAGDYIVRYFDPITRKKQRTYAMKVPAYQKAYKLRLNAGPMRSFGALLQTISSVLGQAISDWIQQTEPNQDAIQTEQTWHTEWQKILSQRANEAAGM